MTEWAFPVPSGPENGPIPGMTLRDYFAIHANESDVYPYTAMLGDGLSREKARYAFADAMLKAREATDEKNT